MQPYLLGRGVDAVTRHQARRLPLIFLAILAAAAGDPDFRFTQRLTINRASRQIENELRRDLFQQLLRLDQRFFQQIRTGDLMARATNDLSAVQNLLGMGLMNIANTLVIFVAAVTLMALIDWQLTILSVSLLTLLSLGFLLLGPQIQKRFLKVQQEFAAVSSKAQENFSGIRVVKAYVAEEHEERSSRQVNHDYVRANVTWARINSALWPLFGLLAGLAGVVLLYVGGPARGAAEDHDRPVHPVQHLPDLAVLADDRARMGGEHVPAGSGFDGSHRRGPAPAARDRRRAEPRHAGEGGGRDYFRPGHLRLRGGADLPGCSRCAFQPDRRWQSWAAPGAARARWYGC